jgi:hypothetical protein
MGEIPISQFGALPDVYHFDTFAHDARAPHFQNSPILLHLCRKNEFHLRDRKSRIPLNPNQVWL